MDKERYKQWIKKHISLYCHALGKCKEVCQRMMSVFPELILYICIVWGKREHWWLKTVNNTIIDPTSKQFPSNGYGKYIEWKEGLEEPTGKCPNCGGYSYNHKVCCSDICLTGFSVGI